MDRDGLPFVLYPVVGAGLLAVLGMWWGAGALFVLGGALALFFSRPGTRRTSGDR
jgi:hypothetical protein